MASKSFASLRFRPIQAKNRSTTQRRGLTAKPIWSGFLRTISTAINVAVVTFSPAYPLSAKTRWMNGKMHREIAEAVRHYRGLGYSPDAVRARGRARPCRRAHGACVR